MKKEVNVITFDYPLMKALMIRRKNRFVAEVVVNGGVVECYFPTTGRVGNLVLEKIPCLLSKSNNKSRKTPFTVEAIAIDENETWLGINQGKMNDIVDKCIKDNLFSNMIVAKHSKREQSLGNSRIDFLIDNTYLEVKMPLISLVLAKGKRNTFDCVERLLKQMKELEEATYEGKRGIVLSCFMYEGEGFLPGVFSTRKKEVLKCIQQLKQKGIQFWIANFRVDEKGIYLIKYTKK